MKFSTAVEWIDKTDRLRNAARKATRRWLHRVGGFVRVVARRSLKRARKMRSEDELSDDQLDFWLMRNRRREREGLEWLDLPDRVSKPGRPPLLHSATSPLKAALFYAVDMDAEQVLIGPERARKGIAHKLEHGDQNVLPRPFMGPAADKARPHMASWWQDAIAA